MAGKFYFGPRRAYGSPAGKSGFMLRALTGRSRVRGGGVYNKGPKVIASAYKKNGGRRR